MKIIFICFLILSLNSSLSPLYAERLVDPLKLQNIDFWRSQLEGESLDLKLIAIRKLASVRNLEAVDWITPFLSSREPELRFQAARSLGQLPSPQSLKALGARANEEPDVYIKAEINRSIQILKDFFEKSVNSNPDEMDPLEEEG